MSLALMPLLLDRAPRRIVALALLAAASAAAAETAPVLTFSSTPALTREQTRIEVGVLSGGPNYQFWFKRTGPDGRVTWTDTRRCPAGQWVIDQARTLPPPRISLPGPVEPRDSVITLDGVRYELTAAARYGAAIGSEIHFTSNTDTPLAAWVEESLHRLAPCWSKDEPVAL